MCAAFRGSLPSVGLQGYKRHEGQVAHMVGAGLRVTLAQGDLCHHLAAPGTPLGSRNNGQCVKPRVRCESRTSRGMHSSSELEASL